jgi:hypothetical protein
MKKRGKLIYLSISAYRGLELIGKKYISRDFAKGNRISYNSACLLLLKFADMGERMCKEQVKNKILEDDDENE